MSELKKILAISGSTRKESTNVNLIKAIEELYQDKIQVTIFDKIADIPHFNPDSDGENVSIQVKEFRELIRLADGVVICTPEYAHGVPGALKNAIDWTVGSGEFYHKPTVLITASTDGSYGHKALLETLRVIDTKNIDQHQLLIQFVKTKISKENKITDNSTLKEVKKMMDEFLSSIDA